MNPFHILILAAGASTRMGRPKQLLPYKETTLLGHALSVARSAKPTSLHVVLGANREKIQESISLEEVHITHNPDWETGMAGSIKCGIKSILGGSSPELGVVIMLGDQPFVNEKLLGELYEKAVSSNKGMAASAYEENYGVPAYFSPAYYPKLSQLDGQAGAGKLFKLFPDDLVSVPALEVLADVDTPEDYQNLLSGKLSTRSE
ncbi:MAG: nucleotidyltransferase family protein [Bacteroidota bacterium]